eukprot:SAG11_NODE_161_length_14021_cov_36.845065_2_plen_304_part_00
MPARVSLVATVATGCNNALPTRTGVLNHDDRRPVGVRRYLNLHKKNYFMQQPDQNIDSRYRSQIDVLIGFDVTLDYKTIAGSAPQLFMRVDMRNKVLSKTTTCYEEHMREYAQRGWEQLDERSKEELQDTFKGKTVFTGYNTMSYRVIEVDFSKCPEQQMPHLVFNQKTQTLEQETQTFDQYYDTKYGVRIRDLKQPLFKCKVCTVCAARLCRTFLMQCWMCSSRTVARLGGARTSSISCPVSPRCTAASQPARPHCMRVSREQYCRLIVTARHAHIPRVALAELCRTTDISPAVKEKLPTVR